MERKNNMETTEIQETELEEISGGTFVQDIHNVEIFQSDANQMEYSHWMTDIDIHGSRN
jgi:hypothetical protein